MRKNIRVLVFALLLAAAYTACQRASEENRVDETAPDSVIVVYKSLNDSVTRAWNDVVKNDDQKISDMRRLLQEISYTPTFNKARYDSLWQHLQQITRFRFEAETMTSQQIDQYDSAMSRLQREVVNFARSHPSFEQFPLMGKLSDSIMTADQRVLFLRTRYDDYAKDYNDFLKGNQGRRLDPSPSDTVIKHEIRPLFQLSE